MTIPLSNVAIQQFDDQWVIEYQRRRTLTSLGSMLVRTGVIGDAYKWPRIGPATMELRGAPQSLIPASEVDYTQITTLFQNWVLNTPTDIFQQAEVNVSDRQGLAFDHAASVARREDQIMIDALAASGTTNVIVDGGTNLTVVKLRRAAQFLNDNNADSMDRTLICAPSQIDSLLGELEVTSTDFNTQRTLVNGDVASFLGFKIVMMPDQFVKGVKRSGLPKTGNIRKCFAWQKRSMGMAYGSFAGGQANPGITVDWEPSLQSWLTISKLRAGASALQPAGIVEIDCDES